VTGIIYHQRVRFISLADIRISRLDVHLVAGLVNLSVGMEEQDVKDTK